MSTNRDPQARARLSERLRELAHTATRLRRSEIEIERELLTSKWPAYHFMSPHAATLHFAELYREAAGRKFGQEFGQNRPVKIKGFSDALLNQAGREYTSMNKARQIADGLGVRYEDYFSICHEFWFNRQRKRLPRPNQLGPVGRYGETWLRFFEERWEQRWPTSLLRINPAAYRLERNQNLPAQLAFRSLLVRVVKGPGVGTYRDRMATWNVKERLLPIIRFRGLMKAYAFRDILDELRPEIASTNHERTPKVTGFDVDLMQSCCGLPGVRDPRSAQCSSCRQSNACAKISLMVTEMVLTQTGVSDPRLEASRRDARERQRKKRMIDKAKRIAAGSPNSRNALASSSSSLPF